MSSSRTRATLSRVAMISSSLTSLCGLGCMGRAPARSGEATEADASVAVSSALAVNEASWRNLWGSWPPGRYSHAAAYDTDRKLLVVYGGQAAAAGPFFNDTWEWDPARSSWTQQINTGPNAGTRSGHAMAYDPVAKKTVMFSGYQPASGVYIPGQWEWDPVGSAWNERRTTSGTQPTARHDHAVIYNPDRQRIVLFGGYDETTFRRQDLWEWNGATGTWEDCTPAGTKPMPRYGHTLAYDTVRKKIIVRGGNTGTGTAAGAWVNETWEWTAGTGAACSSGSWAPLLTTGTAPSYATFAGFDHIVFDEARAKTVLYEYGQVNSVYELDPVTPTWTLITTTRSDPAAYPGNTFASLNYEPDRGQIVLFGGTGPSRLLWEYDGATAIWQNWSVPTNGPIQRTGPALAFDTKRGQLMLFGGYKGSDAVPYKQDIYQWSGTNQTWNNLTTFDTNPPPRQLGAMAYDSKRDRMLLFDGTGATTFDDFWAWNPAAPAWSTVPVNGARPTARYGHSMFYDATRDRVVVYGGSGTQIWEYNPTTTTWLERTPTTIPQPVSTRSGAAVTFDSDRGKLILLGGNSYVATPLPAAYVYNTDVWEWDVVSGQWTYVPPAVGTSTPLGRINHEIVYDSGRRVILLFGGITNAPGNAQQQNDSWEWDPATSTWTETSPLTAVRPLPRQSHTMVYDTAHGTTFVFGGNVTADPTYGPQEIWEYSPNGALRTNGSPCSTATASRCASGNCVDGVCCASTSCPGTCQACNVPGASNGTCANVPPGAPDDTCASDQACDANQQCKSRNGQTCGGIADCASGKCVDGVCCATDCTETCKACNLTGTRGACTNTPAGQEDPLAAPTCVSDPTQGRFCDGGGVCTNAPKALGKPCTASGQCIAPGYCIDGVCCASACNQACYSCNGTTPGTCTQLGAGLQDHSATQPCDGAMQYCASGACQTNKKPNGMTCAVAADCGSGLCVDGICCNSTCLGTCQACNVPGKLGSCVNLVAGQPDNNAVVTCALPQYCDSAGTCQSGLKANGIPCTGAAQCGSGNCVDGFCCDSACADGCRACNLPASEGTCALLAPGTSDVSCAAPKYCIGGGVCTTGRKPNGAICVLGSECGSNNCIDGTCCENSCVGTCLTCKNTTGSCVLTSVGQDPRKDCGSGDCAGSCDGQGGCVYPASGKVCGTTGCASDGVIHQPGTCDGAGSCGGDRYDDCKGFKCYVDPVDGVSKCATSCATDPNCQIPYFCDKNTAQCPPDFPDGHACDRDDQCLHSHCAVAKDGSPGVCCDRDCRTCGTCNLPGKVGTCYPTPAGTDPADDCIDSASDPTGKCGGTCNGQWACEFPAAGTACGTCKQCDGASKCTVMPADDVACGVIDCDTLDTSCMDYHDLQRNRCASLGTCKTANSLAVCTDVTVTCQPDAGAGGTGGAGGAGGPDAMSPADATGSGVVDAAGSDAPVTAPPKGGGGCGCTVGARDGGGGGLPALFGFLTVAGWVVARRRRRGGG